MGSGSDPVVREPLDTLAQIGTSNFGVCPGDLPERMVHGFGSDLSDIAALSGTAKRKFVTRGLVLHLIEIAKERGEEEYVRAYRNVLYCQDRVLTAEGRLHSTYCKSRICTVCSSIRKAMLINKYGPVIQSWPDPYFVTLTVKAVTAEKLGATLKEMTEVFGRILEKHKKRNQRGTGLKPMGLRCLECNFNPVQRTYNPHFHIITSDAATSKMLIVEWLKAWTKEFTSPWAQDQRKVKSLEGDLVELIKYGSKIFTEPDMKKGKGHIPSMVYVAAPHNIICALKPFRLIERFGFNVPKKPNVTPSPLILKQYSEWLFEPTLNDWRNMETREVLTGFRPSPLLQILMEQNMNTDLQ
jgi:hypothetical protein